MKKRDLVWICEAGHIDVGHYSNYLDLCSICGGTCETKEAGVRKTEEQLEREAPVRVARKRAKEQAAERALTLEEVRTYTGDPFSPTSKVATADAITFRPPAPVPPFELNPEVRKQILENLQPRITFPRKPPADHPVDKPYPATVGDVVVLTTKVSIGVIGFKETVTDYVLHYRVIDNRTNNLGKANGYVDSESASMPHKQAPEPGDGTPYSGQFRPEREPEAISKKEASQMANDSREVQIERLKKSRSEMNSNLEDLEEGKAGSDIVWSVKNTIKKIDERIERMEKVSRPMARAAA